MIQFDFKEIFSKPAFTSLLAGGSKLNFTVALENFDMAQGETEDFKVNYAFVYDYFDTTPIAESSVLKFQVV